MFIHNLYLHIYISPAWKDQSENDGRTTGSKEKRKGEEITEIYSGYKESISKGIATIS